MTALADDGTPIQNMTLADARAWLREVAASTTADRRYAAGAWAAARVLLAEVVVELPCTCDYAGLEDEPHKQWCQREHGPHAECAVQIGMLEAERAELRRELNNCRSAFDAEQAGRAS